MKRKFRKIYFWLLIIYLSSKWVFRKDMTRHKYTTRFWIGYKFYMDSWYSIWCDCGIEPWMKGCNIWKIKETKSK